MTQPLQAQHTHPSDPPLARLGLNHPNAIRSPWADNAVCDRLKELWHNHSATQISDILLEEFQVHVTRSAVIGKLSRLSLTSNNKTELHSHARNLGQAGTRRTSVKRARRPVHAVPANIPTDALNITTEQLEPKSCRFITTEAAPWLYCGLEQRPGSSFCWHCHQICYLAPPLRRAA